MNTALYYLINVYGENALKMQSFSKMGLNVATGDIWKVSSVHCLLCLLTSYK